MKYFFTLVLSLFCTFSYAQNLAGFVEVIAKDSLKLYVNSSGILTQKQCAEYYRVAKMHPTYYFFHGPFQDFYASGELAVEGTYNGNALHGAYSEYYRNGKLKEHGNFLNGVKTGAWEYWYENGQLKKVLDFQDNATLVLQMLSPKGKALIVDGNGKYEETNTALQATVKGAIVNGKQDGKWKVISSYGNTLTAEELYDNGRFMEGQSIAKIASFNSKYYDSPIATVDFTKDKIESYSRYTNCKSWGKNITYHPKRYNSKFTDLPFYNHIYENFHPVAGLEGYILAGFKIDKEGNIADIQLHSTVGNAEIEKELINVLKSSDRWFPESVNGKPVETSDLYAFYFSGDSYRILNDSRNDYYPVETGAVLLNQKQATFSDIVLEIIKRDSKTTKGFQDIAATVSFTVDETGNVLFDDSTFDNMLKVSDAKTKLYATLKHAIQSTGTWEPATSNGAKVKHHFLAVLHFDDNAPKLKVFSNNWVLNNPL